MKRRSLGISISISLLLALPLSVAVQNAWAQTTADRETIRSTADTARAAEAATPISQPPPILIPESMSLPSGGLTPEMEKIEFPITQIHVQDPIIFCEEELVLPFQHKLGKKISLGELQAIAKEMTTRYQSAGYMLTQVIVPVQTVEKGHVTLRVISGYIDAVEVEGFNPCLTELLKEYGEAIQRCRPLHVKTLERYSLLASDIPGMKIKVVLKSSKTKVGATDLAFVGSQTYESATLNVNNINSRYLGPVQGMVSGEANSWFQAADQSQAIFVSTGNSELNYGQFRYSGLANCEGLRYNLTYRYARARPGDVLKQFDIRGRNEVYATEFLYPLIRSREENLFFQTGFTALNDQTTLLGPLLYDDRIRPLHASLIYSKLDHWQGVNQFQLTGSQGLKIFNASRNVLLSRPTGKSAYTKLNAQMSRNQLLPCDFSLYGSVSGQYSFRSLLSAAQFGFGGREIGRGYDPSELLADRGIAASIELRYSVPSLSFLQDFVNTASPYAFYDAGKVWNIDVLPSPQKQSATSMGGGLRLKMFHYLDANFYLAKPISKPLRASGKKKIRGFFTVTLAV